MPDLAPPELRDRLSAALGVQRWVDAVAERAPYDSLDDLVVLARSVATPLSDDELDEALAHHPRIGERASGDGASARLSQGEQGGLGLADAEIDAEIVEGNALYEERFGRVFLIRAAGRSRSDVLRELTRRLESGAGTEAEEAKEQLRQIMELRLRTLFNDGGAIAL
ncbi:2-oxo-4-hydroxy-4-carboxy-5-ureidoimidazoline decarboxylase [Herbiconiux sp. L3-i23]|uniref:2-oxo-4-hydroxy-4-carboxy-5-ureidoimidazoline decarboxylase n=1 Tax=Herbiconiux sp. L3-i23 TaxID=2905871 RepID=UPI002050357F|nr:2-oxo-4-hydroxy-4-carboxy-5-ureidoimidazoline decarboxylase [Herbiconiux sp. L3-i23]BDI21413.1 OHCU decarboxylase [Herbiconiux sp. L3-i23]